MCTLSVLVGMCVYCTYCSVFVFYCTYVYSSVCVRIAFILLDPPVFSCCSAEIMRTANILSADHAKCNLSVFGKKPNGSTTFRVRIRFRTI